jgi:hypothetical protein
LEIDQICFGSRCDRFANFPRNGGRLPPPPRLSLAEADLVQAIEYENRILSATPINRKADPPVQRAPANDPLVNVEIDLSTFDVMMRPAPAPTNKQAHPYK